MAAVATSRFCAINTAWERAPTAISPPRSESGEAALRFKTRVFDGEEAAQKGELALGAAFPDAFLNVFPGASLDTFDRALDALRY